MDNHISQKTLSTSNFKVKIHTYNSYSDLSHTFSNFQFHGAFVPSFLTPKLIENKLILELPTDFYSQLKKVSADFKKLEFDPQNTYTLPVFWGIDGYFHEDSKGDQKKSAPYFMRYFGHIPKRVIEKSKNKKILTYRFQSTHQHLKSNDFSTFQGPMNLQHQLSQLTKRNFKFTQERDQLWIYSLVLPKIHHDDPDLLNEWFKQWMDEKLLSTIQSTFLSTALSIDLGDLSPLFGPEGLRHLELGKVSLKKNSHKFINEQDIFFQNLGPADNSSGASSN